MTIQTMSTKIVIKSGGNVFHEIFNQRPQNITDMSPSNIQSVDLHEGEWGKVGTIGSWNYTHDGKQNMAKAVVQSIDEENKTVVYKVIGGHLNEMYKTFITTLHVETEGENNTVTWTFDYEKLSEGVEDPTSFMKFVTSLTKDIEKHHNKNNN
ncbi:kirola-like [Impatiens glandulifera]|uniref:kirola-like n=1 Tax=Impatiens glandulifera TaxID=253017 RepID=UPI001FB09FA6|nr:kirola-like [Impatiens glandulifera]